MVIRSVPIRVMCTIHYPHPPPAAQTSVSLRQNEQISPHTIGEIILSRTRADLTHALKL